MVARSGSSTSMSLQSARRRDSDTPGRPTHSAAFRLPASMTLPLVISTFLNTSSSSSITVAIRKGTCMVSRSPATSASAV